MIKQGYNYYIKSVRVCVSKEGSPYTTFSIRDKIDNSGDRGVYYNCITYSPIKLEDNQKVIMKNIISISQKEGSGKVYYNLSVEVEPMES